MLPNNALIVEDLADSRLWLRQTLTLAFDSVNVVEAATLAEARAALDGQRFDLALIDLGLPDGSGHELIAEVAAAWPGTVCVVTTIFDDDANLWSALRSGAQGYLLKQQPRNQLVDLLRGILDGQPPLSPAIARRILGSFRQSPEAELTVREREVLSLIARGFRITDAAAQLCLSPHTVHGYVKAIYRKLNVSSRAEATLAAIQQGLLDPR